jgi:hypothetical protein
VGLAPQRDSELALICRSDRAMTAAPSLAHYSCSICPRFYGSALAVTSDSVLEANRSEASVRGISRNENVMDTVEADEARQSRPN